MAADDIVKSLLVRIDETLSDVKSDVASLKTDMSSVQADHAEMKQNQASMKGALDEHMRRTALAEQGIELLKEGQEVLKQDIIPLKKHVNSWATAGKLFTVGLGVLASLAGIAAAVYEIFIR